MTIRSLWAGLAMGAGLVAQPAAAEDYFDVLNRMTGETQAVTGRCELRGAGTLLNLTDPENGANIAVRVADRSADAVRNACAPGGTAALTLSFSPQSDVSSYSEAIGVAAPASAISVSSYLTQLNAEAASITSITGQIVSGGLSEVYLRGEGFSVNLLVSLGHMPVRTAMDYLNTCFEVCAEARFELRPIEFVTYGGWTVRQATGWSLMKSK